MHIQAGQCGNQIGAKVRLSRPASCVPTSASPSGAGGGGWGRERLFWELPEEQREEPQPLARLLGPRDP